MSNGLWDQLTGYYKQQGIHPESFACRHQAICRSHAYQGNMTETKMSMVGSRYGHEYPRIVVLSLDPPAERTEEETGRFVLADQRTTNYVTEAHEADDYTVSRPNVHWAMTQIIVKDLLSLFGYMATPGAAVVLESYAGRPIENVSAYFAHVNVAKCSMNDPNRGQAHEDVHTTCGSSYLLRELQILRPQILITQGQRANEVMGNLLGISGMDKDLPKALDVKIGTSSVLCLPMVHPARHLKETRDEWPAYVQAVRRWAKIWQVGSERS